MNKPAEFFGFSAKRLNFAKRQINFIIFFRTAVVTPILELFPNEFPLTIPIRQRLIIDY